MIKIKSQTALHQYDESGRAITTWDNKKCSWIVNEEFENEDIDWWGEDNDFPAGETRAEFEERNPNWDKMPNIHVTWRYETANDLKISCGLSTSAQEEEWYRKTRFPYSFSRSWEYLDYAESEAIEQLGKYCGFNKGASVTTVRYNGKTVFEGKLE